MSYISCFVAMMHQIVATKIFTYFFAVIFQSFTIALIGYILGVFADDN